MARKVGIGVGDSDGDGVQPGAVFVWGTGDDALAYAAVAALIAGLVVVWVH